MQWTSSSSQEELRRAVRQEQLRLLFEMQPFNIAATFVIAAIVALTLTPVAERSRIVLWCGFLIVGNGFRAAIAIAWRRDPQRLRNAETWRRHMLIAAFLAGLGWGLCDFLLFPVQGPTQQMLLVFITCGISAAAAVSLSADPWVAWSFLIPCALPLEWQLFWHAREFGPSLTAMGVVYLLFLATVIDRQHRYITDNIAMHLAEVERERRQNEIAQELRSSQEKLQALFELSPLGCMLTHADGRLIEANRALLHMLRFNEHEFPSFFNVGLSAPSQQLDNRRRWYHLIQHGGTDAYECELVRRDGSLMPASLHRMVLDTSDGQKLVWTIIEDITERRRNELQLQALTNRFSLAAQAGGIGVWELDLSTDTLTWDERMFDIYGVDFVAGPLSGEVAASAVHPDDWDMVRNATLAATEDPAVDRIGLEFRVMLDDGEERWLRSAGLIQRDAANCARRITGVAWDITELKRVARMKSEFVSSVSHELRTPLTSIRGSLGLVANGVVGEIPAAARELIDIASKNCERLALLINDILDIEKIESGKMWLDLQPQSLRPLLEQAVAANAGYARSFAVQLLSHVDTDAIVAVDANRFMQVMANLISNAVKFSPAGERVEIVVRVGQGRVRIDVCDRGPGIPAEFRQRIFQRFSQADASDTRARGGSGLGLAITKTLVERMRGEIGFTDRVGGGTIFFVELPY